MKKNLIFLIAAIVIILNACNDPIFYDISKETKILEALIKGAPSNFVEFKGSMYTASGKVIWRYDGTDGNGKGKWEPTSSLGGYIQSLAAAGDTLYALVDDSSDNKNIIKYDGNSWDSFNTPPDYDIRSIYSAGGQLFIGAYNNEESKYYIVYYISGNDDPMEISTGNNLINGVVKIGVDYYLSARNQISEDSGQIYKTDTLTTTSHGEALPFMGIIDDSGAVYAITRDGKLYDVTNESFTQKASFGGSYLATGALAVWQKDSVNKLLLAGRQDTFTASTNTGYTYGYLEWDFNAGSFKQPDIEAYASTIGKIPVNHIYQAPDGILFASTQKDGIWSLRERGGKLQWNSEEKQ